MRRAILTAVVVLVSSTLGASLGYSRGRLSASRECAKKQTKFGEWCTGEINTLRTAEIGLMKQAQVSQKLTADAIEQTKSCVWALETLVPEARR